MKIAMYTIIVIILLTSFGCEKESTKPKQIISIEDLLVKNNEITGWSYSGSGWIANNISDLYTYINGAAEIYQRHGFVEAANQSYQGKIDNFDRKLELTIYNQGNESNARELYQDPDIGLSGAINWDNGAGKEAQYIRNAGLSQVLTFYRKPYFVLLQINHDTEESLNIVKQFALNVDEKIE